MVLAKKTPDWYRKLHHDIKTTSKPVAPSKSVNFVDENHNEDKQGIVL